MSTELIKARTKITSVNKYLKQEKLLPAIVSLHEAIGTIVREPLLKHEKDEFSRFLGDALEKLNNDEGFRKVCPIVLEYRPGDEKNILSQLKDLLEELQGDAVDEARKMLEAIEKAKRDAIEKGRSLAERKKFDKSKAVFDKLLLQYREDTDLKAEIGEIFLKAERYEDALEYLKQALEDFPESVHLYNRIAIVLRKMENFDLAEQYFKQALQYGKKDPGLFFNMGRLYIDWKQWEKVEKTARLALKLKPDFAEAQKMLSFAQKRIAKASKPHAV